jgi:5-methylcytosine-specific restriction endonuclease McrA
MAINFYAQTKWIKLRNSVKKEWRSAGLVCAVCGQPLQWGVRGAVVVDHILNRKQYPDRAYDRANLQCVCHGCNTRKAHHVELNDKEPIGEDGLPASWR